MTDHNFGLPLPFPIEQFHYYDFFMFPMPSTDE
jgi:hypothetical protein